MTKTKRFVSPGVYRTAEGRNVIITRVENNRAYGRLIDTRDTTWWYPDTGQHGLYTPDDLVKRLTMSEINICLRNLGMEKLGFGGTHDSEPDHSRI